MSLPEGAELGTTTDPKALIKGEPSEVRANATLLSDEATRVGDLASEVDTIAVAGWTGGLGQPAYAAARSAEQDRWEAYGDLLTQFSSALSTYASALTTAQSRAADAIAKWQEGEDATAEAVTAYNSAVETYNSWADRQVLVPLYGGGATRDPAPPRPGPFVDPGESLRQEAQQILDDARTALENAGATALKELGGLPGAKTDGESGFLNGDGSVQGPSIDWGSWEKTFGDQRRDYPGRKDQPDSLFKIDLGEVEGSVELWGAEGSVEDYWGDVKVHADGSVTVLGADAGASGGIDKNGLTAQAHAGVTLVGAEGSAGGEWGYAEGEVSAEAKVGAEAEGDLAIGPQGVHAGGEAFAGGKISAQASGDVAGVGGEGGVEGWAGVGAAGDIDFGFHDGKIEIGGSGGVAVLVGGKVSGNITIDPGEMIDAGGDLVKGLGGLLR